MNKIYDLIVIGGGPAGIMSAISAKKANKNLRVAILEGGDDIGQKLRITGGGRCNFTNDKDISDFFDKVVRNKKFLYSSLYTYSNESLKDFIKKDLGLEYTVERENDDKVYISSGRTDLLIERLREIIKKLGIDLILNAKVMDIFIEENYTKDDLLADSLIEDKNNVCIDSLNISEIDNSTKGITYEETSKKNSFILKCSGQKNLFSSRNLVVAVGGMSYPKTGSDGSLYEVLSKLGIKIVKPKPALVPIILKKSWLLDLMGLSFKDVALKNGKVELFGDLMITHDGIGGPVSLKMSSYINRNLVDLSLDIIPNLLDSDLYKIIRENQNKNLSQILLKLEDKLPHRFVKTMLAECNRKNSSFDFERDKVANLSKENFEYLLNHIKNIKLEVEKLKDIRYATVTSGGVDVSEIDPSTMESKKISGMYFAGEIIDVDALTGGYNLQIAFSTGFLSGISI